MLCVSAASQIFKDFHVGEVDLFCTALQKRPKGQKYVSSIYKENQF